MIDFSKPVQTRDGVLVRILCTDRKGSLPVLGLLPHPSTEGERVLSWRADGSSPYSTKGYDLENVPDRHVKYLHLSEGGGSCTSRHLRESNIDAVILKVSWDDKGQYWVEKEGDTK